MSASDKTKLDATTDYIVDRGTSGKWTYEKYASGIAKCWGIFGSTNLPCSTKWGSLFTGTWMGSAENKSGRRYPFKFVETPTVIANPLVTSGNFWIATNQENDSGKDSDGNTLTSTTHAPAYQCVRATSATITNPSIHYYVVGRWK